MLVCGCVFRLILRELQALLGSGVPPMRRKQQQECRRRHSCSGSDLATRTWCLRGEREAQWVHQLLGPALG